MTIQSEALNEKQFNSLKKGIELLVKPPDGSSTEWLRAVTCSEVAGGRPEVHHIHVIVTDANAERLRGNELVYYIDQRHLMSYR